jgi:hypothetical protein
LKIDNKFFSVAPLFPPLAYNIAATLEWSELGDNDIIRPFERRLFKKKKIQDKKRQKKNE